MWIVWLMQGVVASAAPETWARQAPVPVSDRAVAAFAVAPVLGKRSHDPTAARKEMMAYARGLGWPVLGGESRGPDRTVEARFVLGGELRALDEVSYEQVRGTAVEVWWQLVDRRHDNVLYEVSTLGWSERGAEGALKAAFAQVLARPSLVDTLEHAGRAAFLARGAPVAVQTCPEAWMTTPKRATVSVRQGRRTAGGVIVSPDGWVWTSAEVVADPSLPVVVQTSHGRLPARWIAADADSDVALLSLPLSEPTGCAALAPRIPHVRETVSTFNHRRRRVDASIVGFKLQQDPPEIVVEPLLGDVASPAYDHRGALVGMRTGGSDLVLRPHTAVSAALGTRWTTGRSSAPAPPVWDVIVDRPDPGFETPPPR